MIKRCNKIGLMSTCKQTFYDAENEDEDKCYYHRKVRDGLIVPGGHEIV